jgi:UPF0755 protein
MKTFVSKKILIPGVVFLVLAGVSLAFICDITRPVPGRSKTALVDIHRGYRFLEIVDVLHREGVIRNKVFFYLLALSRGAAPHIKAGEYEFPPAMSPSAILDKLIKGDIKRYRVTIPEDLTVLEIADRLAQFGLIDRKHFTDLSADREFLSSLGIEGETIEGYLYPETYFLDRSMGAKEIIIRMVAEFWKHITPTMKNRAQALDLTLQEWITLASIIGKETGYGEEKDLVSAVFHNRLKKGMKLQSDPTAVYNLKDFRGPIKRRHLDLASSHNTYRINGLPPGPIANPGLDSLQAALYPATANYLYFVSRNDGTHFFSTNYLSHRQAVKKYQVNEKKQ